MKILHIAAGNLSGGAARGTYWLHLGLRDIGLESRILTSSKSTLGDQDVNTINRAFFLKIVNWSRRKLDRILPKFLGVDKEVAFSTGLFGYDFTNTREYHEADVIHLHWINAGFVNISDLKKIKKPIVWTLRDMWPMTGGCHYALGCDRFKIGCGQCPLLNGNKLKDLSKFIWSRKKKFLNPKITLVGISNWISEQAKESELFRNFPVHTIENNIDLSDFFPEDKEKAKKVLSISTNRKIVLVGAHSVKSYYKGFDKFLEALTYLDGSKYLICTFGNLEQRELSEKDFEFHNFGFINDVNFLRAAYSMSDVFVAPSIMEAFGKTIAESMASGTPVVCFNATGPRDIVDHKVNGYKAEPFDPKELAKGIEWISKNTDYSKLSANAIEKVRTKYDSKIIAKKYESLYENIVRDT